MSQTNLLFSITKNDIEKLTKCPACKSRKFIIFSKLYVNKFNFLDNGFCKNCSLQFKSKRPKLSWFLHNFKKREQFQKNFNINPININTEKIREYRYLKVAKFLSVFIKNKKTKLLDIGTGTGLGLRSFNKYFSSEGIEPDISRSKIGKNKGFKIYNQTVEKFRSNSKYQFVTMIHSLEHFHNIDKIVKKVKRLLMPGGYLYIEVPDLKFKKFNWNENLYLAHMYNFCEESLINLGFLNGFKPKYRFYPDLINEGYSIGILFQKEKKTKKNLLKSVPFSLIKKKFFPKKYFNLKLINFILPEINDLSVSFKSSEISRTNVLETLKQKNFKYGKNIIIKKKLKNEKVIKEIFSIKKIKKKANLINYYAYKK